MQGSASGGDLAGDAAAMDLAEGGDRGRSRGEGCWMRLVLGGAGEEDELSREVGGGAIRWGVEVGGSCGVAVGMSARLLGMAGYGGSIHFCRVPSYIYMLLTYFII